MLHEQVSGISIVPVAVTDSGVEAHVHAYDLGQKSNTMLAQQLSTSMLNQCESESSIIVLLSMLPGVASASPKLPVATRS